LEDQRLSDKVEDFKSSRNNSTDNLLKSKSKESYYSTRRGTESSSGKGSWLLHVEPAQHNHSIQQQDLKKDLRNKVGSILGRGGYDPIEYAISRNACDDDEDKDMTVPVSDENTNGIDVHKIEVIIYSLNRCIKYIL
jgi:hypothetical protein